MCCVGQIFRRISTHLQRAATESWQIHFKDLRFGRLIGRGNVGKVYDGRWRSQKVWIAQVLRQMWLMLTIFQVAIKMLLGGWLKDEEMVERFRDEIYLMSTMHHPNGELCGRRRGQ